MKSVNRFAAPQFVTLLLPLMTLFGGCATKQENGPITEVDLVNYVRKHKTGGPGDSPDYAILKHGKAIVHEQYLSIIMGMADNKAVCEDLIRPLNTGQTPSVLSGVYECVRLND